MAINKIQLEQDGLVVGNNQLTASGGGVYIGKSLSVANVVAVGDTSINTTAVSANVISVGNTSVGSSINATGIVVSDAVGNATTVNSIAINMSGNSITPFQGMRNRLINGDMLIWQRGTSNTAISNSPAYVADRWYGFVAAVATGQQIVQSTDAPTGFLYSAKFGRPVSNTITASVWFCQNIESVNVFDIAAQPVTLSFWAKVGNNYSGGPINVRVATGTTADQSAATFSAGPATGFTGYSAPINTTQLLTNTWKKYSFTGFCGSGILEMAVAFGFTPSGTAGADDNVYITGVQLEKGPVATPFEKRQYGTELGLCQRYYSSGTGGAIPRPGDFLMFGFVYLPVTMRANPTTTNDSSMTNAYALPGYLEFRKAGVSGGGINFNWTAFAEL